jgi:hypothetical protein
LTKSSEIHRELVLLADTIKRALARSKFSETLRAPAALERKPQDSHTNGYWLSVGRLDQGLSVQIWLDHFAGLNSPRLWMGLRSRSPEPIQRLARAAKQAGFLQPIIKKTTRDATKRPPYRFIEPLQAQQFEVLVHEAYAGDREYYLGIFRPDAWPLNAGRTRPIARELVNLLRAFTALLPENSADKSPCPGRSARG